MANFQPRTPVRKASARGPTRPRYSAARSISVRAFGRAAFLGGHPGSLKALLYGDNGYMGSYADALAASAGTSDPPNTAVVRNEKHWKIGAGLNIAQEIAPHIGLFTRLSAMNGTYEAYDFTDIDRSISGGLAIDGGLFHRPNDAFGLAVAENALSSPAEEYFSADGLDLRGALPPAILIFSTWPRSAHRRSALVFSSLKPRPYLSTDKDRTDKCSQADVCCTRFGPLSIFAHRMYSQLPHTRNHKNVVQTASIRLEPYFRLQLVWLRVHGTHEQYVQLHRHNVRICTSWPRNHIL